MIAFLLVLLLFGFVRPIDGAAGKPFNRTVLFEHKVWPSGWGRDPLVYLAKMEMRFDGDSTLLSGAFVDIWQPSMALDSSGVVQNASSGALGMMGFQTSSWFSSSGSDFTAQLWHADTNQLTTLCKGRTQVTSQVLSHGLVLETNTTYGHQSSAVHQRIGAFDVTTCAVAAARSSLMPTFNVSRMGKSVWDSNNRLLYSLYETNDGGIHIARVDVYAQRRISSNNTVDCDLDARDELFLSADGDRLIVLKGVQYNINAIEVSLVGFDADDAQLTCKTLGSWHFVNEEPQAPAYDPTTGLVFVIDGYTGYGVVNLNTKKSFRGYFGWGYNNNAGLASRFVV
jgi:hypothetical protein